MTLDYGDVERLCVHFLFGLPQKEQKYDLFVIEDGYDTIVIENKDLFKARKDILRIAKENIDKGSGQFKGIGTIDKEVTNNAINNVVASNMPVNKQAMYNVLSRDPSKLDAFEFMARRPNMSYYPGAKGALNEFYNENTL